MNPPVAPPPAAFRIRPFQACDIEQVLSIAASSPSAPHWPRQSYVDLLGPVPPARQRISLVVDMEHPESGVRGFAIASVLDVDRSSELESIVIHAGSRNQGLGGRLLDSLLLLASRHADIMHLEVRSSNLPAIALYRSHGFRQTGRRPAYYRAPSEDAILFERPLICL